jgi:hypothetical protein
MMQRLFVITDDIFEKADQGEAEAALAISVKLFRSHRWSWLERSK